jgi:hypothetical protein
LSNRSDADAPPIGRRAAETLRRLAKKRRAGGVIFRLGLGQRDFDGRALIADGELERLCRGAGGLFCSAGDPTVELRLKLRQVPQGFLQQRGAIALFGGHAVQFIPFAEPIGPRRLDSRSLKLDGEPSQRVGDPAQRLGQQLIGFLPVLVPLLGLLRLGRQQG